MSMLSELVQRHFSSASHTIFPLCCGRFGYSYIHWIWCISAWISGPLSSFHHLAWTQCCLAQMPMMCPFFFHMTWKSRNLWQRETLKILLFCSSKICNHKWTRCPMKLRSKVDSVCSNAAQCHAAPAMDVIEYQRLEGYLRAAPNTRLKNPAWALVSCQFKRPATYHTTKGKVSAFFSCGSDLL